jgi:pimeloyl-ACP methyl ester carboxylesterase
MTPIHFSHANGFPAKSYQYLFDLLQPHPVTYINVLGAKNPLSKSWDPYIEELIQDIESKHNQPVVGIGHSFGGALTLKVAMMRPDLFSRIIILDPPVFGRLKRNLIPIFHFLGITEKAIPIVKKAANRRAHFSDRREAFEYWKGKRFFQNFHPNCFQAYVDEGLKRSASGDLELTIPARQEVSIFKLPTRLRIKPITVPGHYVYATQNGVLDPNEIREHRRNFPNLEFIPWEGQHMFPLEEPAETAAMIKQLISQ